MENTLALGASAERLKGSSPFSGTNTEQSGFFEANIRDALRASHLLALKKPLSSILVSLFYQARTYFQNR